MKSSLIPIILIFIAILALAPGCDQAEQAPAIEEEVSDTEVETVDADMDDDHHGHDHSNHHADTDVEVDCENDAPEELDTEEALSTLYLMDNQAAGLFFIGASVSEVEELAAQYPEVQLEHVEFMAEGMAYPAIELVFDNSGKVELELSYDTVSRITVDSYLFETESGIGVGSHYDELSQAYDFDGLSWGDGGNPIAVVEDAGMSFIIEPGEWWQGADVEGDIPPETEVTAIIVW